MCSSGMASKFMPQMPTSSVGTARMPAHAASCHVSFWRIEMSDRLASSALDNSSRSASTVSLMRTTWS